MSRPRAPLAVAAFAVVALGANACGKPLRGTLWLNEPVAIKSATGVRQLAAGIYSVKVTVAKGKFSIDATSATTDVSLVIDNVGEPLPTESGTARVAAAQSGQPFDLRYTVDTSTGGSSAASFTQPCTYEVTETVCRFYGTSDEKETCFPVTSTRRGTRLISQGNDVRSVTVSGQLLDPRTGREIGQLRALSSKNKDSSAESPCG